MFQLFEDLMIGWEYCAKASFRFREPHFSLAVICQETERSTHRNRS